jgi:hypothetical protein
MLIHLFPHLSTSYSMLRYFTGLSSALADEQEVRVSSLFSGRKPYGFKIKYIQYAREAARTREGYSIIFSELFSFLVLFLKKDTACVICHDLLTLRAPKGVFIHKVWFRMLLFFMMRAKVIVCISEATRTDLLLFEPRLQQKKIKVVYNGLEEFWHSNEADLSVVPSLPGGYFLMVGTDAWNKNFTQVIHAWSRLEGNVSLVKVGAVSQSNYELMKKKSPERQFIHIPDVSDLQLKGL